MNFIYILPLYNTIKIGSTKYPINRLNQYKTGYYSIDNKELKYLKLYLIDKNCYDIDEQLKYDTDRGFIRYRENGYINVGTEFYKLSNINLLEKWFDKNNIIWQEYNILNCQINNNNQLIKENNINLINSMINLRDYQYDTYNKMVIYYNNNNTGILLWSCGLGKTIISLYFIKRQNYKKILIGVPSIILRNQFIDNINNLFIDPIIIIDENPMPNINKIIFVVTTYHSCNKYKNNIFDFIVGDECHHLVSNNKLKYASDKQFIKFHNLKATKKLYMTATIKNALSISMNNKNYFGNIIDEKKINWAIENKYITDYRFIIIKDNNIFIDLIFANDNITNKNLLLSCYLTLEALHKTDGLSHILLYTNSCENSDLANQYIKKILDKKLFNIKINDIYYNALHSKNNDINNLEHELNRFKLAKYGIISCINLFGEGFDIPILNGIVIAENMESYIKITQYCMRANRLFLNKNLAYYIIPYIADNDKKSFEKIITIINNFRYENSNILDKIRIYSKNIDNNKNLKNKISNNNIDDYNYDIYDPLLLTIKKEINMNNNKLQEYNFIKNKLAIYKFKTKYDQNINKILEEYKLSDIENIENYFIYQWINWYKFLGIDYSEFPKTKSEWYDLCKDHLINWNTYMNFAKNKELPLMPNEYFQKIIGIPFNFNDYIDNLNYIF